MVINDTFHIAYCLLPINIAYCPLPKSFAMHYYLKVLAHLVENHLRRSRTCLRHSRKYFSNLRTDFSN